MYNCPVCGSFAAKSYGRVLTHIQDVHQFESGFHLVCAFCPQTYSKVSSYKSHLYRKHRAAVEISDEQLDDEASEIQMEVDEPDPICDVGEPDSVCNTEEVTGVGTLVAAKDGDLKRAAALFILKAREVQMITQDALDALLPDITALFHINMKSDECGQIISPPNPFAGLETEYLQNKYFKEHLDLLEPIEVILGQELHQPGPSGHKAVNHYCYYVSLIDSLQMLLNIPEVQNQVFNSHESVDGLMRDYCDGEAFKKHPIFSSEPHGLQIELYYDDIDVCNPIGSKAVIHKHGLFYFTLKNIEPALRSRLQGIWLLAVVRTQYIADYGINTILDPIVKDIKKLESDNGVEFNINGESCQLRGALTAVVADNPASHLIGGFKSLCSAFRKCRQCMATSEDVQTKFHEDEKALRTKEGHKRHVEAVSGPAGDEASTAYGVNHESVLNELKYFHVTTGLPPDIMHDVLEGVAVVELKCMLEVLIKGKKILTLPELNRRIQLFPYGYADSKSKPLPLTCTKATLNQNASQMWCLLRLLPLIMGDLVPEDDPHWENYLTLLEIINIVFAPVVSLGLAHYLQHLVGEHHETFIELYPHKSLPPKFHYLIHMPRWLVQHGPLKNVWAMRYEAKNKYFKKWAKITGNFKNVAKTAATHHQRYMCYHMASKEFPLSRVVVGPAEEYNLETDVDVYKTLLMTCHPNIEESTAVFRVRWVEIKGIRYRKPLAVLVEFQDGFPVFGKINDVLKVDEYFYLVLTLYKVNDFDHHYNAYYVQSTKTSHMCSVASLKDHQTLCIYQTYSSVSSYIPLKYHVED